MRFPRSIWLVVLFATLSSMATGTVASAGPPGNRAPHVPFDLATEYPQPEPVLRAVFADPDGGSGQVLYSIYGSDGAVVMKDVAGPVVPSGSDSPLTIPPGTLQDGVLYSWTARSFDGSRYSKSTTTPNFVGTGGEVSALSSNPWGCWLHLDLPHRSDHQSDYIVAQARTRCTSVVPYGWNRIEHRQSLFRSSWRGWMFVASNNSICDRQSYDSGQSPPECNFDRADPRMRAWVRWNCVAAGFRGTLYHYRQVDTNYIYHGGITYSRTLELATGPWFEPGSVRCGA
jgi:hypothetical protein